ncbi:MAG: ABC transporter permease [Coriobacteriia bacterium]|nr:ABC transporter permease [Coriobacteriia bacterium]
MNNIKAVIYKQALGFLRDKSFLIQFFMFPAVAFVMTEFVARPDDYMPDTLFVGMFAAMFAGMILIPTTAGIIAGDKEGKSLRLMVMSGVKPVQYLIGIMTVLVVFATITSLIFVAMVGAEGSSEVALFLLAMIVSVLCSILLGASLGISAKSVQAATSTAIPVSMVLGMAPMLGMFNETIGNLFQPFYTMQTSRLIENLSANPTEPLLIIAGNIVVFIVLFLALCKRRGLQGP